MKLRTIGILMGLMVSALAMASLLTRVFVEGQGRATGGDRTALVKSNASKSTLGSVTSYAGGISFDFSTATLRGPRIAIMAAEVNQSGNVGVVAGTAVFGHMENGTWMEVRGRGRAVVTSNRHPNEAGANDVVSFHFQTESGFVINWEGTVNDGDLSVGTTYSY